VPSWYAQQSSKSRQLPPTHVKAAQMESSTILPLVWYYLLTIFIVSLVYSYSRSWYRLRDFKGPWLASLTEGWLFGNTTKGDLHMRLYEVNKKYGLSIPATSILPASLNQICMYRRSSPRWPELARYQRPRHHPVHERSQIQAPQVVLVCSLASRPVPA